MSTFQDVEQRSEVSPEAQEERQGVRVAKAAERGGSPFVACYLMGCLAVFVALAVLTWGGVFDAYLPSLKREAFQLYVYVSCAGGLGAVVYCLRGLYLHVSAGDYDPKFVYWYVFRPLIGFVLGLMTYFLIVGGLLVFDTRGPADTVRAKAMFIAVAFLAGFSSNEFISKISAVAKALFGVDETVDEGSAGAGGEGGKPSPPK